MREEFGGWNNPDPFVTLHQKRGDYVYFGVHDLSKYYRDNGGLPNLNIQQAWPKMGQVVDADPIDQTVTVLSDKAPFHYGYKKLEDKSVREKRRARGETNATVKLPVNNLIPITHMFTGLGSNENVWLVIDGNTQYQQDLMREIRRREVERAHAPPQSPYQFRMQNRQITPFEQPPQHDQQPQEPQWSDDDLLDLQSVRYDMHWRQPITDARRFKYYPED